MLAQVERGELRARLPASPPETAEPFASVLRDLDDVLLPGLTHWQSPRFFAYFASTASEPGILAELLIAGLNQVGILWRTSPALQELEELTLDWLAQLLGLPDGLHGHIEDTASTGTMIALAAARHAKPGARVVVCSEHTHSSVDKACRLLELELRPTPADAEFRLRADALDLTDACAVVATVGTTSTSSIDPVAAIADAARARRRLAARRRRLRGLRGGLPRAARALRRLGARRLDRRQPAQVAVHADGLLGALDPAARRPTGRLQLRARVPARQRGGGEPLRVQPRAGPALPRAQAVDGAALLRPDGAAGADPRGDPAGRAVRGLGARRARLGGWPRRGRSRSSASASKARMPTTRPCSSASTRAARSSSRTRS